MGYGHDERRYRNARCRAGRHGTDQALPENQRKYAEHHLKKKMHERDQGICRYCGQPVAVSYCQADHLIPFNGMNTVLDNLVTSCRECNRLKAGASVKPLPIGEIRNPKTSPFDLWAEQGGFGY